jgi:hypothetical protein
MGARQLVQWLWLQLLEGAGHPLIENNEGITLLIGAGLLIRGQARPAMPSQQSATSCAPLSCFGDHRTPLLQVMWWLSP